MVFNRGNTKKNAHKISDNFYFFHENGILDCNVYCIVDKASDEIALFDAGNATSLNGLIEGLMDINLDFKDITKIFITHEHVDHVLGLYPLMEKMKDDPPEIFAYGETAKVLLSGDESQIFPGNLGLTPSMFGVKIFPLKITDISGEKEVNFSDFKFQIHYTPGHSLGSICYYESNKKILIPGDVVFTGGSFGRYDFPGGSLKQLQDSIKFITTLNVNYLLPGHMGISNNGNKEIQNSFSMIQMFGGI